MADTESSTTGNDEMENMAQALINILLSSAASNEQLADFSERLNTVQSSVTSTATAVQRLANSYTALYEAAGKANDVQSLTTLSGNASNTSSKSKVSSTSSSSSNSTMSSLEASIKELSATIKYEAHAKNSGNTPSNTGKNVRLTREQRTEVTRNQQQAVVKDSQIALAKQEELEANVKMNTSEMMASAATSALAAAINEWKRESKYYIQRYLADYENIVASTERSRQQTSTNYWGNRSAYMHELDVQLQNKNEYNQSYEGRKFQSDKATVKSTEAQEAAIRGKFLDSLSEEQKIQDQQLLYDARILRAKKELSLNYATQSKNSRSNSLKDSLVWGLRGITEREQSRRGVGGFFGRVFGNMAKGTPLGDAFNGGIPGAGVNLGFLAGAGTTKAVSVLAEEIGKLGKEAIAAYGDIEQLKTNLSVVYGNKGEANNMFSQISDYAVRSPFGVQQMTEYAVLLKQSGIYSSDLMDTLKMLGDTVGGNQEKMKRVANNFAQIVAAGTATTRDLREFANAGIPIYDALKKELGVSAQEVRNKTSNREVTADIIEQAFKNMTSKGGVFYNATSVGAKTYKTQIQNLKDTKQLALANIGEFATNIGAESGYGSIFQGILSVLKDNIYPAVTDISKNMINSQKETAYDNYKYQQEQYTKALQYLAKKGYTDDALTDIIKDKKDKFALYSDDEMDAFYAAMYEQNYNAYNEKNENMQNGAVVYNKIQNELGPQLEQLTHLITAYRSGNLTEDEKRTVESMGGINGVNDEVVSLSNTINTLSDYLNDLGIVVSDVTGDFQYSEPVLNYLSNAEKEFYNQKNFDVKEQAFFTGKAVSGSRNSFEMYEKYANKEGSSTKLNDRLNELYQNSDAAKLEKQKKDEEDLAKIRKAYQQQIKLNLKEDKYGFIGKEGYTTVESVLNVLKNNFTAEDQLNFKKASLQDPMILKQTKDAIKENLTGLGSFITSQRPEDLTLQMTLNDLSDAVNSQEDNGEQVSRYAGELQAYIEEQEKLNSKQKDPELRAQNESLFALMKTVLTNPTLVDIDNKKIDAAAQGKNKEFTDFWRRYSASTLGISVEGISKGQSITSQYKNLSARSVNQAIAKAMMTSGVSPEEALSNIKWNRSVATDKSRSTIGVDQEATAKAYEKYATSVEASAEVTQAYLEQLQSQESQMQEFFSGAAFKAEDLDKLYDPEWASALGYTNKESFVNAFSAMTDASGHFTEATLKSVSAILQEVQERKANVQILSSLKNSTKEYKQQTNQSKADAMMSYYRSITGSGNIAALSGSWQEELLKKILEASKTENGEYNLSQARDWFASIWEGAPTVSESKVSQLTGQYGNKENRDRNRERRISDVTESVESSRIYQDIQKRIDFLSKNNNPWVNDSDFWGALVKARTKAESKGQTFNATEFRDKFIEALAKKQQELINNAVKNDSQLSGLEKAELNISKAQSDADFERNQMNELIKVAKEAFETSQFTKNIELLHSANVAVPESFFNNGHRASVYEGLTDGMSMLSPFGGEDFYPDLYRRNGVTNTNRQQVALNYLDKLNGGNGLYEGTMTDFLNSMGTIRTGEDNTQWLSAKDSETNNSLTNFITAAEDAGIEVGNLKNSLTGEWNLDALENVITQFGILGEGSSYVKDQIMQMGNSVKDTAKSGILNGIDTTWQKIGEGIAGSGDAADDLAKAWKDVAANMLSSIGSAMTQCGLNIAAAGAAEAASSGGKLGWGKVAAGLALAAAGGVASISSGILSYDDSSEDDDDDTDESKKIQNLKDTLSDLIDQAKTDAEYYQKNLLHKNALAANESYSSRSISVNDAVITPSGNVINTAPDDYLIATKTPDTLVNNNNNSESMTVEFNPTIKVVNQTAKEVNAEVQQTTDENGNIEFDVIIKNVISQAIADGDMDSAFAQRDYRINGKSVAW